MNNIPSTSKENPDNEIGKIIPPTLMKNFDCVILLLPKKTQEEPTRLIELESDEMDSQLSVNSSNDTHEFDLIDFSTDTDKQNASELNANQTLPIDVDELEKWCLKLSEEKSKKSLASDNSLSSKTSEASYDDNNKIIEIDDKPVEFPKLRRACSDSFNPNNRSDANPKISETSNVTKIAGMSDTLFATLSHFLKSDAAQGMDNKTEVSGGFKRSASETPQSSLSNFKMYPENTNSELYSPIEVLPKLIRSKTLPENIDDSKCPLNPIARHMVKTSEISDMHSLDLHPENEFTEPNFDKKYKTEDIDESYDDLHDDLSIYKKYARMNLTNNIIESGKTSCSQRSLTQPETAKVQCPVDKLLNNRTPTYTGHPVTPNPISLTHSKNPILKSIEAFDTEAQNTYMAKLLNSKTRIQNLLMYYDPKNFYEPDPRNNEEFKLTLQAITKNQKVYNKKRIITSEMDREKFTVGPDFTEKQYVLPQIMKRLKEKKARLESEKNLQKRLLLGSHFSDDVIRNSNSQVYKGNAPIVTAESSSVELNPVVLTEDCNSERLKAFKKRKMFEYFADTGNYL